MKRNYIYAIVTVFIWSTMAAMVKKILYDIPNFEGYQATKSGKIWSKKSNKFLQGGIDEKG